MGLLSRADCPTDLPDGRVVVAEHLVGQRGEVKVEPLDLLVVRAHLEENEDK